MTTGFVWMIIIGWVVGFLSEFIFINYNMGKLRMKYPDNTTKCVVFIILFMAWPYFHFYGKLKN